MTICSAPPARSERPRLRGLAALALGGACLVLAAQTPDDPLARGSRALGSGDATAARRAFAEALAADEASATAWLGLAAAAELELDWVGALSAARRAATLAPERAEPHLAVGRALARLDRVDAALSAFAEVRRLAPRLEDGYLLAALLLRDEGRGEDARALLEEGWEAAGGSALAGQLAFLALEAGDLEAALHLAEQALGEASGTGDLMLAKALALAAMPPRRAEAGEWFARALAAGVGHDGRARLEWARWAAEVGDWQTAAEQLERATRLLPDEAEGFFRLAQARRQTGDAAGAAEALRRYQELEAAATAATRRVREVGTALNEAQLLAHEDRLAEALDRLAVLPPDVADARVPALRAKVLFSLGRRDEARAAAATAAALAPEEVEPAYLHALFAFATDRFAECLAALDRVLALEPELGEAWALRGSALARGGRLEEAAAEFERALDLGFDSASLRLDYAGVLSDLGRPEESRRQIEARQRILGDGVDR